MPNPNLATRPERPVGISIVESTAITSASVARSSIMHAAPEPLWDIGTDARSLWNRLATTAVLNSHPAMVKLMRYCQLLATWQNALKTIAEKGVAQAIKSGDGKGIKEAKMLPHADYVLRVEAIMARLETEIEWRAMV